MWEAATVDKECAYRVMSGSLTSHQVRWFSADNVTSTSSGVM